MKKVFAILLSMSMVLALVGCGGSKPVGTSEAESTAESSTLFEKVQTGLDFVTSIFKHINNGGIEDESGLPYNVDAITGATMTVEGPAMVTSIPLSVRELENRNDGLARGIYADDTGAFLYEGLDLYYLLNEMVDGDNGIVMTDSAYRVILKNSNREDIVSLTLEEVTAAHEAGRPALLAYGKGTQDGTTVAPFVFDAKSEGEHSLGYVEALNNDDGCIRLVLDNETYGDGDYNHFSNVAYVYVCEEEEPGFKHSTADSETYGASRYTDYVISVRGAALGHEIDLTVEKLEALVQYDADGEVAEGGIGYSDFYSLANNAYWYVNEYEGLDLYKLLQYLGMPSYEEMGSKDARTTLISFIANDGALSSESFSVDTLSYPDAFGFYKKNASDMSDGTYVSTNADLVKTGYPVLMAYGVNNYPYTILKTDDAYLSGLSNSGGPMRIVFGKTQYNHANGSNQVQYLRDVLVGEDVLYNTHAYTTDETLKGLADSKIKLQVNSEDGSKLIGKDLTIGQLEALIYGEDVESASKKAALVKDLYETGSDTDVYEGVSPEYFLMNAVGIPGTNGTVTFSNGTEEITVSLDRLFATGYNAASGRSGMNAVLAFAKNGSPMVASSADAGYISEIALNPVANTDPAAYAVNNCGGPLKVIIPATSTEKDDSLVLENVTSITVDLIPDSYAHIEKPYDSYATQTIKFYGEGLDEETTYTVEELEGMQNITKTLDYSVLNKAGESSEQRYRGIPIYAIFSKIGIKSNAGEIHIYSADGYEQTYSLSLLKKEYENFLNGDKPGVSAILAFGTGDLTKDAMEGLPLVESETSEGYDAVLRNDGGPLRLIVPQDAADSVNSSLFMKNVVAVEVTANDVDTWSHSMSDVYSEYLDSTFTLKIVNEANEWSRDFTVKELEEMKDIIERATYSVLDLGECEGINLWKFVKKVAGDVPGIENPISVTVYAADDYKNDLLSLVYMDGLQNGIDNETGETLPVILCYAIKGYPLVAEESHPGYTGLAGNGYGPIRAVVEGSQGGSVKLCVKLVVTIPGTDPIDIQY